VANLRTQPRHPAELSTQAMLGTPVKVWKSERGWYLVQTPDQYMAWVDGGGLELMDSTAFHSWQQKRKVVYTQPYGFAYAAPARDSATVSDLVYGDVMELKRQQPGFYEVGFPDGRTAFVPAAEAAPYRDWASSRQPTEENLVSTARRLMGLPYLWGGTSIKGVDCSGFTKTIYFMNGLVLPRDASQQVAIGEEIDTKSGWQNLRPGDLLFFGAPAREGRPERVVHVGMWIGNGEFIHSAGRVQVGSLIPGTPNYDESEHKRFLRAKRINSATAIHDLRKNLVYEEVNGQW
jgi:cell wall-associated NlpC family hydrolase